MLRENSMVKTTKSRMSLIQHCKAVSVQRNVAMYGCMCNDGCGISCNFGPSGAFEGASIRLHNNEKMR